MTNGAPPAAIVVGLSPTGLHCVRTLARAGVRVIGVAEGRQAGMASRYLSELIVDSGEEGLLTDLLALASRIAAQGGARAILIPSSDQHVEFISRNAATLAEHFVFQPSYRDGLAQQIMAKDSFYRLCDTHGIRYPALRETDKQGLPSLVGAMAFPWMVKPAEIHRIKAQMRGEKGWILRNEQDLSDTLEAIPDGAGTLLVQEIVPGPESAITLCCAYFDGTGAARQMFSARKLRQYPPGFGSASLVQSEPCTDSIGLTKKLLGAIGYRGIAASEFKRHPDTGQLFIIEVNVRPSLWFSISEAAGRPVVLEAYRAMAGLPALEEHAQQRGVRWHYGLKDIISRLFYRRNPGFILPAPDIEAAGPANRTTRAVFARDDWKPALAEIVFLLQKALTRLTARRGQARQP